MNIATEDGTISKRIQQHVTHCLCITRYIVSRRQIPGDTLSHRELFHSYFRDILPAALSRKFLPRPARISRERELYAEREICSEHRVKPDDIPLYLASSQFLLHSGGVKPTRSRSCNENIQRLFTAGINSSFRSLSRSEGNCGKSTLEERFCTMVVLRVIVFDAAI